MKQKCQECTSYEDPTNCPLYSDAGADTAYTIAIRHPITCKDAAIILWAVNAGLTNNMVGMVEPYYRMTEKAWG